MVFKIKQTKKHRKKSDYIDETIDDVYGIGFNVVERSNPFYMSARSMGEEPNGKIQSKKKKKNS